MKRRKAPDTKRRRTANSAWLWLALKLSFPLPYCTSHWIIFFMFCPARPRQPFSFTGHICFYILHEASIKELDLASMLLSPDWYKQLQWTLLPNLSHLPDSEWDDCRGNKAKRCEQWDLRQPRLSPEQLCMCDFFVIWQLVSLPYGRTDMRQLGTSGLNTDYFIFFVKETQYCIAFYSENKFTYTCIHKYIWQFESSIPQDFR